MCIISKIYLCASLLAGVFATDRLPLCWRSFAESHTGSFCRASVASRMRSASRIKVASAGDASGHTRPGCNRIGGFPEPDFLWATTSPFGDYSAAASFKDFQEGRTRLVRFSLRAVDFTPWPEAARAFPAWTPELIALFKRATRFQGLSPYGDWCARAIPLPQAAWLSIETRGAKETEWQPFVLAPEGVMQMTD